jgi:MFS transporter, DHA2 family, multidrug resistance protein
MAQANVVKSGPVSAGIVGFRPLFAVGAVLIGSFLASFDTRLFSLALPDIRGAMSLSFDEGAWLSTITSASQILIAPAVAWLATVFGLRRVLGIPSLVYAVISLLIPFVKDYNSLLALSFVHGILLGTFVPATLMIIFRNLPIKWWLPTIAIYCIRVGFSTNSGISLAGFYVDHVGWQWMYWQDVFVAPLMGLFVYLGTSHEAVDKDLLKQADWAACFYSASAWRWSMPGLTKAIGWTG